MRLKFGSKKSAIQQLEEKKAKIELKMLTAKKKYPVKTVENHTHSSESADDYKKRLMRGG